MMTPKIGRSLLLAAYATAPLALGAAGFPVRYDDFESGNLAWPYTYQDSVSAAPEQSISTAAAHGGKKSLLFKVNTAGGEWGAGGGFGSSYASANGGVNATGATRIGLYIKTDKPLMLGVGIKEGMAPGRSPLNEEWKSPMTKVAASAAWQKIEIPFSSFKPKKTEGNGLMDLANVSNVDLLFAQGTDHATVYVDDVYFTAYQEAGPSTVPAKSGASGMTTAATVPLKWPLRFEDLETGSLVYGYDYKDDSSQMSVAVAEGAGHSGKKAVCYGFDTSAGSWGAGGGFGTSYPTQDGGGVNATGASQLSFWAKSDRAIMVQVGLKEGVAPGKSPLNEEWQAPLKKVTAGAWQKVSIPLSSFKRSKKTLGGNNTLDLGNVTNFDLLVAQGAQAGKLYVDDIYFEK